MNLAEFARWVITESVRKGCDLDGGEVQEKAVELGILVETKYDPAVHGTNDIDAEAGDTWFVFSEAMKASIRKTGI